MKTKKRTIRSKLGTLATTMVSLTEAEWSSFISHSPAIVRTILNTYGFLPIVQLVPENKELFDSWKIETEFMSVFHESIPHDVAKQVVLRFSLDFLRSSVIKKLFIRHYDRPIFSVN